MVKRDPDVDSSAGSRSDSAPPVRRKRRRRIVLTLAIVLSAVVVIAIALSRGAPVGHFVSGAGKDAFALTYQTAFDDLPDPSVTVDVRTDFGVVRAYRFDGASEAADPLVLLPGTASASPVWADNLTSLLEVRDVYTIDLLGEPGMSVQDRPIETEADQAAWLSQVLDALPERDVNLLGLSVGGWTAANLATRETGKIATLTLVDPIQVFDDMPLETVVRSIPVSVRWLPKSWRDDFNSWTAGGAPVEDVPVADMIESAMQNYHLALPAPSRISEERLEEIDVPVLSIIAGESVMHDADEAIEVAERVFVGGTVELYPDASHAINGEYPDDLAADIATFLDDVG